MKQLTLEDKMLIKTALFNYIQILRSRLIDEGMNEGLSSEKTLLISQELDEYIYLYQVFKQENHERVS
nr:aspartyl-phosphate phosphatase Spo0E family protein [uncultured Bacillus sp.]